MLPIWARRFADEAAWMEWRLRAAFGLAPYNPVLLHDCLGIVHFLRDAVTQRVRAVGNAVVEIIHPGVNTPLNRGLGYPCRRSARSSRAAPT